MEVPALDDKQGGLLLLGEPEAQYQARGRDYRWGVYIEGLALTEYGWGSHLLRMHILRVLINEGKPVLGELKVTIEYHQDSFLTFFNQGGPGNNSTTPASSGRGKFEEMLANTLTNSETLIQQVVQFTDSGELLLINPVKPVTVQRFR